MLGFAVAPILLFVIVNPYDMYCDGKIMKSGSKLSPWCFDKVPNLYDFVQK